MVVELRIVHYIAFIISKCLNYFLNTCLKLKQNTELIRIRINYGRLLAQLVDDTEFKTDLKSYEPHLVSITVCAEAYRYNFLIDCNAYHHDIEALNPLLDELVEFAKS